MKLFVLIIVIGMVTDKNISGMTLDDPPIKRQISNKLRLEDFGMDCRDYSRLHEICLDRERTFCFNVEVIFEKCTAF